MSFATAQQEHRAAHRGFRSQATDEPPKKFCEFRHEIGQRLIDNKIRIDDAIEEVTAHVAGNPDGSALITLITPVDGKSCASVNVTVAVPLAPAMSTGA